MLRYPMHRTLTVTAAADDLHLLTLEEMREAAGVDGASDDTELQAMSLRISAAIMAECNIAVGSGAEPTLRQETLTETFRNVCLDDIWLSRRHDISITSITADGLSLTASDYLIDTETGMLSRLCDDQPSRWYASKITVVYKAGFSTIPGDLKQAAMDFFRLSWLEKERDPMVKSREVPGVITEDFWVGSVPGQSNEGAVPDIVAGQLKRFRNLAIG